MLKRTAMITQAGVGRQTLRTGTVTFKTIALRHRSRVHICISKGIYRKLSCLREHNTQGASPLELTSKVTTEFVHNGISRGLHKELYCRIDVISKLKCMQKMPPAPNKM